MNTKLVNSTAGVINAALTQNRTAAGIAMALESAGLLMTPETGVELKRLRARVAELEADAAAVQEGFKLLAEGERRLLKAQEQLTNCSQPSQVDAYLRTFLAEDAYLKFQQAIGEHAIAQTVEDTDAVRAAADNEGLYNNDWREGWDDFRDRVDPDQNGPYPVELVTFADDAKAGGQ